MKSDINAQEGIKAQLVLRITFKSPMRKGVDLFGK